MCRGFQARVGGKGESVIIEAWAIGHEDSVGLSICKVHISATRWRIYA
jgi:hypothetical protein